MNSYCKRQIVLVSLFLSIAACVEGQDECELKKESEDLKIYTCSSDDSKLKVLKSELILRDVSLKELRAFVSDVKNYVNWQYNTKEVTILKRSADATIYRTVVEAPWPLLNRDIILELTSQFDSVQQVLTIVNHHVSYDYPEEKDLVRVPIYVGIWHVSVRQNDLNVEYNLRIDPGGTVPVWLVNIAMAEGPYYSFMKLKEYLKQRRR